MKYFKIQKVLISFFVAGILVLISGYGSNAHAQVPSCPPSFSANPVIIEEGTSAGFFDFITVAPPPLMQFQWFLGSCLLGNQTSPFTSRSTRDSCVEGQFGPSGRYVPHPGAITFVAYNGTCTFTGSMLFHLVPGSGSSSLGGGEIGGSIYVPVPLPAPPVGGSSVQGAVRDAPGDDTTSQIIRNAQEHRDEWETSSTGPCTREELEKLLTIKAQLESQAAGLESAMENNKSAMEAAQKELDNLKKQQKDLAESIQDKQKDCDNKDDELTKAEEDLQDATDKISDTQDAIHNLQQGLTNGGSVTEYHGNDPLGGVAAGAAVSFDGGSSWVVMHGEAGVNDFLDAASTSKGTLKQLNKLKADLSNLKKEKEKLEQAKVDKQKAVDDCQKELDNLKKQMADLEAGIKNAQSRIDDLAAAQVGLEAETQALNDMVDAFNALAEKCGIAARKAYLDAKAKLAGMPPEDREKVEDEFENTATKEEKDARTTADQNPNGGGGGGGTGSADLTDATRTLEEAMVTVSKCPPPSTKQVGPLRVTSTTEVLKGVDAISISNSQGTRGATDKTQKEAIESITLGINVVDKLDTLQSILNLIHDANPVNLIYGIFQGKATDAILDKLKERQKNGTLRGLPKWIEVTYGPMWELPITTTTSETDHYICSNNIRKFNHTTSSQKVEVGECLYIADAVTMRYDVNIADLDLRGCSLGGCPAAWKDAFNLALKAAFKKIGGGAVGLCSDYKATLTK